MHMSTKYKEGNSNDTVSSFVKVPPPKKSCPASVLSDLSLSSNGGNPHVKTCIRNEPIITK